MAAIVLFGSAAEGWLRATSDVNVLVIVKRWRRERVDKLRDPVRTAIAGIRLAPMFVRADELADCAVAFAEKFSDIMRRRKVLVGADMIANITIPRAALVARERQTLLNLAVRLRQLYLVHSLRDEQAAQSIADLAGPLRVSAATLAELAGQGALPPKEALELFVAGVDAPALTEALATTSAVREERAILPGAAPAALSALEDIAIRLRIAYGELAC